MQQGTTWFYRGYIEATVPNTTGPAKLFRRNLEWRSRVAKVVRTKQFSAAIIVGHPLDLAWYEPGRKPRERLLVKYEGAYYTVLEKPREVLQQLLTKPRSAEELLAHWIYISDSPHKSEKYCDPDQQDRDDSMYCWFVEDFSARQLPAIAGVRAGRHSVLRVAFRTMPDHIFEDIVPGIGLVSLDYSHHGTLDEVHMKLVRFCRNGCARTSKSPPNASGPESQQLKKPSNL